MGKEMKILMLEVSYLAIMDTVAIYYKELVLKYVDKNCKYGW